MEKKCNWNKPLRPGPLELGFDYYFGVPKVNSRFPYVYVENDRIVGWDPEDPLVFRGKTISPNPTFPPEAGRKNPNAFAGAKRAHEIYHDEKTATLLTEKAIDWIEQGDKEPFFLYFATTNIHHPFTPAPRFKGTSQCGLYGDFIHELDWMVGKLLSYLDKHRLAENTLVIFTSDNGGMFNIGGQAAWKAGHRINGDLLGFKFSAWEGGHRVPFIARWPGKIEAATSSDQLICHVDMLSTCSALTGQAVPAAHGRDSLNILPALVADPTSQIRDHLVMAPYRQSNLAIRKDHWILIRGRGGGGFSNATPGSHDFGGPAAITYVNHKNSDIEEGASRPSAPPKQLYNLKADIRQEKNVYREYSSVVHELESDLERYLHSTRQE